jgi:hypothetical protein
MPRKKKGPADANRRAFYKLKLTFPIVPFLHPEAKGYLRALTLAYREVVTSEDPRVIRLGLQLLWLNFRDLLQLQIEGAE